MAIKIVTASAARLGDTLFCTPAYRFIATFFKDCQLDVIALTPLAASVLSNNLHIHQVLLRPEVSTLDALKGQYALGINLHDSKEAKRYFADLAIPLLDISHVPDNGPKAERLLRALGGILEKPYDAAGCGYEIVTTPADEAAVNRLLATHQVDPKEHTLIAVHIGCHGLAKSRFRLWQRTQHHKAWPLEKFIGLTKRLTAYNPSLRILITGSAEEAHLAKPLTEACPVVISLINQTSVSELAALMKKLKGYISNDTGTLHVACSTKVPLVALYPTKNIANTGPYPPAAHRVLLHRDNLDALSVDEVFETVVKTFLGN